MQLPAAFQSSQQSRMGRLAQVSPLSATLAAASAVDRSREYLVVVRAPGKAAAAPGPLPADLAALVSRTHAHIHGAAGALVYMFTDELILWELELAGERRSRPPPARRRPGPPS
eukprot:gene7746-7200_t